MFDRFWARGNNLEATRESTYYLFKIFMYMGVHKPFQLKSIYGIYSIISNFCICLIPLTFVLSFYYDFDKMSTSQLLTSIQVAIDVCGAPAKVLTVLSLYKHLQDTLEVMDILDKSCQMPQEYKQIHDCSITGKRLTILYVFSYFTYSFVAVLTSLIMGQPPYSLFMPKMNWRNSGMEFMIQTFLEYMLMNMVCLHQAALDVYGVIYIYIIRTHMQILVKRVGNLGTEEKQEEKEMDNENCEKISMEEEENNKDTYYEQLVKCIEYHQYLLR